MLRRPVSDRQRTRHSFLETLPGYMANLKVDIESGRHLDEENLEWGVRTEQTLYLWLGQGVFSASQYRRWLNITSRASLPERNKEYLWLAQALSRRKSDVRTERIMEGARNLNGSGPGVSLTSGLYFSIFPCRDANACVMEW